MKLRNKLAAILGALSIIGIAPACSMDNNGSPASENLYRPDINNEAYRNFISKLAKGDNLELVDVREGRVVAQFNQDGLKISFTGPGEFNVGVSLQYVDEDELINLGVIESQPFTEPLSVNSDIQELEISFDDLIEHINIKKLPKDTDVREKLNDGSILVNIETQLKSKSLATTSIFDASVRADYFTGEYIDAFVPGFDDRHAESDTFQTSETSEDCGYDFNGKYSCSTDTDYYDNGHVAIDVIGNAEDLERKPENYKEYFIGSQKVIVSLVDDTSDSTVGFNGIVTVDTTKAQFEVRVKGLSDDQSATINVPRWAGEIIKVAANGRGSATDQRGFFGSEQNEYFDVGFSIG